MRRGDTFAPPSSPPILPAADKSLISPLRKPSSLSNSDAYPYHLPRAAFATLASQGQSDIKKAWEKVAQAMKVEESDQSLDKKVVAKDGPRLLDTRPAKKKKKKKN